MLPVYIFFSSKSLYNLSLHLNTSLMLFWKERSDYGSSFVRFFEELKRRRALQLLALYIGSTVACSIMNCLNDYLKYCGGCITEYMRDAWNHATSPGISYLWFLQEQKQRTSHLWIDAKWLYCDFHFYCLFEWQQMLVLNYWNLIFHFLSKIFPKFDYWNHESWTY